MNWTSFFLGCFVVGLTLSTCAFGFSALHALFQIHIPFVHHFHLPHAPAAHAVHSGAPPVNFATMMAFLAWFGGTGYLLTSQWRWVLLPALTGAVAAGFAGAGIVFWVMAHVLWSPNENMRSVDASMLGVLGRVGTPIREGGTGELIYTHGGTRHSCGARSADGRAIEKGSEVVVTAFDRGIAYVQRWEEFALKEGL